MSGQRMKGTKGVSTAGDTRFMEVMDIVCENVGVDWVELAQALGLRADEIAAVKRGGDPSVPAEQCWEALCKWRMKTSKALQVRNLCDALIQCRQKRVADVVYRLVETPKPIDDVLSPHLNREEKLMEAMYTIVDEEASHWRNIGKHLGLNDRDIISIEKRYGDRTREKCMHTLYKWRHMVTLNEYKISNLVMALRQCGLNNVAGIVKNLGTQTPRSTIRKPRQGELLVAVNLRELDLEIYTPTITPNSTPRGEPTPRPKNSLPEEVLSGYVLNKVFFHLLDRMESQDKNGAHPLVEYLFNLNSELCDINRKGAYLGIYCRDKRGREFIVTSIKNGEFSKVLSEHLMTAILKKEIGLKSVELEAKLMQ